MKKFGVVLITAIAVAGCSSSSPRLTVDSTPNSSISPSASAAVVAACHPADQNVVTDVAGGLKQPATSLVGAISVSLSPTEQAAEFSPTLVLAARVSGGGNAIGTWIYGNGSIDALNTVARTYSEWGALATPDSPAAAARAKALKYPETLRAAKCAAGSTAPGPSASIGANTCGFPPAPDVIYWFMTPGQSGTAQLLGAYNFANCTRTADQAQLDKTSPQGAGFCTIVASLAANPGYNVDAPTNPRPKGILAQSGAGC